VAREIGRRWLKGPSRSATAALDYRLSRVVLKRREIERAGWFN